MSATASQTPATPLPVATTVAAVSTTATTTVSKGYKTCHEVPPLSDDGSDYAQWNFCTQLILESRGLWDVVTGVTPKPDQVVDPTGYEEWCQKDRDAKIQIALSLKKGPFNIIASATPPGTVGTNWQTVSAVWASNGSRTSWKNSSTVPSRKPKALNHRSTNCFRLPRTLTPLGSLSWTTYSLSSSLCHSRRPCQL